MVRNEEKYQQAVEFRKRGFTYYEIAKIVGVSKSTVSEWLSRKKFSKQVKKDNKARANRDNRKRMALLNKARNTERDARYTEAVRSAEVEYKHYKHNSLFIAGLMLYLGHGATSPLSPVRLTTNNPKVHRIFISFIKEYTGVEDRQVHFWLLLYSGMKEEQEQKWWSRKTGLSVSRFGRTQFIRQKQTKTLQHGTGNTIIGSTVLKRKLSRWIELALADLKN